MSDINVLGRRLSGKSMQIAADKKMKVAQFQRPRVVKDLMSFLGLTNHSREFIEKYAHLTTRLSMACPYTTADPKGKRSLEWTDEMIDDYEQIKLRIAMNEGLAYIKPGVPFELRTDASNIGVGGVISQTYDGERHDIAFTSMKFNETQKRWPTIEQEAFGIFFCVQHWADLLIRQKFRIYTDHRNLTFVLNAESKKLTRWRLALQEFVFDIVHIAGEDNVEADYLSRVQFD